MEFYFGAFTSEWEQKRAALLHEMSLGGRRRVVEDDLDKRLKRIEELGGSSGGGGGRGRALSLKKVLQPRSETRASVPSSTRSMDARLTGIAKGSQPAVVKMASYGGGARVGSMLNYVSRAGELKVETENGEKLQGSEELARIRGDWDHLFQNRAESRDIGAFSVEISGLISPDDLHERVRDVLNSGFSDRRYAYTASAREDGSVHVEGLVVLRSGQGKRLTADAKAAGIVQEQYDSSAVVSVAKAQFSFHGHGNGVDYGTTKLRALLEAKGEVRDERGQVIGSDKDAGDLVQKEWRSELHSRKSRDVMHVIMSARAGTDAGLFEHAVRDFLADQFAGHRYVFAMHDPANDPKEAGEGGKRPHVHAHAIVTMRSESGDRVETTPAVFRQWREVMAEKARAHGIQMEMTDRREFAAPPAFTRNQVRAVNSEGRTEHVGTSEPAQARYDAKRSNRRVNADSLRSRQYTVKAKEVWQTVALASGDKQVVAFANQHRDYLESGLSEAKLSESATIIRADFGSYFRTNMVSLQEMLLEGQEMREQTRPEFEAYEKSVETALFKLERSAGEDERASFDEVSGAAREIVNIRREILEIQEREGSRGSEQAEGQTVASDVSELKAESKGSDIWAFEEGSYEYVPMPPDLEDVPAEMEPTTLMALNTGRVGRGEDDTLVDVNAGVKAWEAAVSKHGQDVAWAGDDAMRSVELYRQDLNRVEAGELPGENKETYQAGLNQALTSAAQLAVEGNGYLRDIAKDDADLQAAVEKIEQTSGREEGGSNKPAVNADSNDERQRDLQADVEEQDPNVARERDVHELAETVDATNRQQDRVSREKDVNQRSGETSRTDPAQQHIPRLEELEREQAEQKERDRDDRDR